MARTSINRSISFDPEIFEKMETRRAKLMMDRSDYVKRCVLKDMLAGGTMSLEEVSPDLIKDVAVPEKGKGRSKNKK